MIVRKELICERKRFIEDYISPVSTGHYETIQVVDSAATANAREACRSGWQATIDNLNNGNINCMVRIGTELTQMKTNCNKELKTWQTKRNETRTALKDARLQKAECGHIVKYKTITVYVA